MFTVTRLGVTGALLRTVASTNPVESMIEIVRDHGRNVQRWKDGDIRLRWAAAGMLAAAGQFRRVQGYAQLPQLAGALAQVGHPPERLSSASLLSTATRMHPFVSRLSWTGAPRVCDRPTSIPPASTRCGCPDAAPPPRVRLTRPGPG